MTPKASIDGDTLAHGIRQAFLGPCNGEAWPELRQVLQALYGRIEALEEKVAALEKRP